jgi:hypothetical protein
LFLVFFTSVCLPLEGPSFNGAALLCCGWLARGSSAVLQSARQGTATPRGRRRERGKQQKGWACAVHCVRPCTPFPAAVSRKGRPEGGGGRRGFKAPLPLPLSSHNACLCTRNTRERAQRADSYRLVHSPAPSAAP